jgi:hypothetical protein
MRCRLCSCRGADRMRVLDFDEGEQPLCLACVRPYDQGLKAGMASAKRDMDQLAQERYRLGDQARDYLEQLARAREQLETLRTENRRLRDDLDHGMTEWRREEAARSVREPAEAAQPESEAAHPRTGRPEKPGRAAR